MESIVKNESTPGDSAGEDKEESISADDNDNDNDNHDNEECVICQDVLKHPITLPCKHQFCSNCLEQWRSKYDATATKHRTCPSCRSKIPVTREMLAQLELFRLTAEEFTSKLENPPYHMPPLDDFEQWKRAYGYQSYKLG